jgi:hypothetical protein
MKRIAQIALLFLCIFIFYSPLVSADYVEDAYAISITALIISLITFVAILLICINTFLLVIEVRKINKKIDGNAKPKNLKYCNKCGAEISDKKSFCWNCGEKTG